MEHSGEARGRLEAGKDVDERDLNESSAVDDEDEEAGKYDAAHDHHKSGGEDSSHESLVPF